MMERRPDQKIKFSVGALLYSSALNGKLAEQVISEKFNKPYSLAICLEDTVSDEYIEVAEKQLLETLQRIHSEYSEHRFFLPKIFIRVRSGSQLLDLYSRAGSFSEVITGFILPKYSPKNLDEFNSAIKEVNEQKRAYSPNSTPVFMMPILESGDLIDYSTRHEVLHEIKSKLDEVSEYVLNIRVGGNDLSNGFAVRRGVDETIYDILPIAQLLGDILTVFAREYVISGAVWEYFADQDGEWEKGLRRELKLDRLNGFVGKTVIHPRQISVVNDTLKVSQKDYEDARTILNWGDNGLQVGKSLSGERMNEVKTHRKWAEKTLLLAELYGITRTGNE